jgi:hypothetical protein
VKRLSNNIYNAQDTELNEREPKERK